MTDQAWLELKRRVNNWAKETVPNDYNYGSPQSYWITAYHSGIITSDEFDLGKRNYGNLWTYRGD